MMKELAMEELKILEAQHPTRYQFLKLELKEFIHLLDQQEHEQSFKRKHQNQNHPSVLTQESSNRKREKMKMKREDKTDEHQRKRKKKKKCNRDE